MERRTKNKERRTVSGLPVAFTLVELMVVVAVISILLMLLIPNIRTMREKAWSSQCQNNLRQYGIAMNQYMADNSGYFIYPGAGGASAGAGYGETKKSVSEKYSFVYRSGGQAGSVAQWWGDMIATYLPTGVTVQSLTAGNPSVKVCPAVLQQVRKDGNFFDTNSPNFKGLRDSKDWEGDIVLYADFEQIPEHGPGYDTNGDLILDPAFTTYAVNPNWIGWNKKNIPENAVAFIDWNAKEGWWAELSHTNWQFNGINSQGAAVVQDDPKQPKGIPWCRTEVGFHHLQGNVYGANYVAMDGHVGWVGSNAISITNFITGL